MGAFKLGKMTFGSLFKKPETILYPFESKPQPDGLKGHIVVDVEQCILCGMCDKNCTTDCITVNKAERYWEINPYGCIQCGYCVTICPKKCLHMDPNYSPASPQVESNRFTVPVQEKPQKAAKEASVASAKTEALKTVAASVKDEPAQAQAKAQAQQAALITAATAPAPAKRDAQLDALMGLMDPEKAKIVESALAGK